MADFKIPHGNLLTDGVMLGRDGSIWFFNFAYKAIVRTSMRALVDDFYAFRSHARSH